MALLVRIGLPEAIRTRVAREEVVGLQADLAAERRLDFAYVRAAAGEQRPAKLRLDEELGIESVGRRVKGSAGDSTVNCRCSYSAPKASGMRTKTVLPLSEAPTLCAERSATTSAGLKLPPSSMRARI